MNAAITVALNVVVTLVIIVVVNVGIVVKAVFVFLGRISVRRSCNRKS
jgi:hypothetical protein